MAEGVQPPPPPLQAHSGCFVLLCFLDVRPVATDTLTPLLRPRLYPSIKKTNTLQRWARAAGGPCRVAGCVWIGPPRTEHSECKGLGTVLRNFLLAFAFFPEQLVSWRVLTNFSSGPGQVPAKVTTPMLLKVLPASSNEKIRI